MKVKLRRSPAFTRLCAGFALFLFSGGGAFADLQECSSLTTLQDYIGTGSAGCRLGDKIVSNFTFSFAGGSGSGSVAAPAVPPASAVMVNTRVYDTTPAPAWVALEFDFGYGGNATASVRTYQTMDLKIQYVVTSSPLAVLDQWPLVGYNSSTTDAQIEAHGAVAWGNTTALASMTTEICPGGPFGVSGATPTGICTADTRTWSANLTGSDADARLYGAQSTSYGTFAAVNSGQIGVYNYLQLLGGSTAAVYPTAASRGYTDYFYSAYEEITVPEPGAAWLAGLGLAGVALLRRRGKPA